VIGKLPGVGTFPVGQWAYWQEQGNPQLGVGGPVRLKDVQAMVKFQFLHIALETRSVWGSLQSSATNLICLTRSKPS